MKKIIKAALLLWLIAHLAMNNGYAALAEEAVMGTEGDGSCTTTFYVLAEEGAQLTLFQSKGTCYELTANPIKWFFGKGSSKAWGKFHVVYFDGDHGYQADWEGSRLKGQLKLVFPKPGMYVVEVIPYTKEEINENWKNDYFLSWTEAPKWWIAGFESCKFYSYNPSAAIAERTD